MDLVERFRYIMKLNNMTASAFAEVIGVQASSVSHILSGRNKPSLEFIQKVLTNYPKIDAAWLINGTTNVQSNKIKVEEKSTSIDNAPKEIKREKQEEVDTSNKVKKVLIFYTNGTFEEFQPS